MDFDPTESEHTDEENLTTFSTDRGGGDADLNYESEPRNDIISVKIQTKKRESDPEAYLKWLKAKNEEVRKIRQKTDLTKQECEKQKQLEEEMRKEMSKEKIKQWMDRKKKENDKNKTKSPDEREQSISSEYFQCSTDSNFKSWLSRVKKREEEKKNQESAAKQMEDKERDEKKKLSQEVYRRWLKTAHNKPKPVPLNQGLNSLRGTVSKIFINPEPWKN
ncbi:coiled-coil domain-containing protein 34-like [Anopheles nili]|uniref:coiled-coil domain-containing protein 34-like n=1 Tax=Anopheles nili TaxID=185578 RepID=UPI00237C4084|nr:coiled-coil domain-containing protein 34-like [Anopheles nili]